MSKFILDVTGEVNDKMYRDILYKIPDILKADELLIVINSVGGSTNSLFAIYDLLLSCNKKITTIALGRCASCAAVLFLIGDTRYVARNTSYMLHSVRYTTNATYNEARLKEDYEDIIKINQKLFSIVEERLQKPKNWAKKIYRKKEDSWFTLDELLSMEIATDVLEDISVLYNE
jgi:endopeptidase Clp